MEEYVPFDTITAVVEQIRARTSLQPEVGLILGSGLSQLADAVEDATIIPYSELPSFPAPAVAGHRGELVVGRLAGVPLLILRGRFHFYEGYSMQLVTLPVRVMQLMGIKTLIVTNAAGGLNADWSVGDVMILRDHVFFPGMMGFHPLRGANDERLGPRFPAMLDAYDPTLASYARTTGHALGMPLREGVYGMLSGPSFETGAEMNMLRGMGIDVVGMSTAPEAIVARHGGLRVLGMSLVTNIAHPDAPPANHAEVLEAGEQAKPLLSKLMLGVLEQIAREER